jgi:hypothetical protein
MRASAGRTGGNGAPSVKRAQVPPSLPPKKQRSVVTNGRRLFATITRDGRSGWSRRFQDILRLHISDLGGDDFVSDAERSIVRRIATITTELEFIEQRFAESKKGPASEDLDLYFRGSNSLRRHLEAIGLKRVARDITPTLEDYIAEHAVAATTEDAEANEDASP